MSGIAGGLLLIPLIVSSLPMIGAIMLGRAVLAGDKAAEKTNADYEKNNRGAVSTVGGGGNGSPMGSFRETLRKDMEVLARRSAEVSYRAAAEMSKARSAHLEAAGSGDAARCCDELQSMAKPRAELNAKVAEIQDNFSKEYASETPSRVAEIAREAERSHAAAVSEMKGLLAKMKSEDERNAAAAATAGRYINEARAVIESLEKDFHGRAFTPHAVETFSAQLSEAAAQKGRGRYETAIAVAKDASLAAIDAIYKAASACREWENYHKLSLMTASEIGAYLDAQAVITPEMAEEIESRSGIGREELVGVNLSEYTEETASGEKKYDLLKERVSEIMRMLHEASPENTRTARVKEILTELNERIYPEAASVVYDGLLAVSGAFTRQSLSEEIIGRFEERNFTFSGYGYEDGRHDGALYIGLSNEVTGEEIIVTLSPDISGGEASTKISIDQIDGDGTDEERRAFYRKTVSDAVSSGAPESSSVSMECDQATRDMLSPNKSLRDKLSG
ncbi:hypothetical protein FACS1894216_07870 [Synergistales bacterium]|nr:hypothetical protein FACS1894216_07870 [Synergistales bacterium]